MQAIDIQAHSYCYTALLLFLIALCSATLASAQETKKLTLTVTQLAGENVYLNGGTDDGIMKGDTLFIQSEPTNKLIVFAVSSKQSIVQFAQFPFPVTRGQQLAVGVIKGPSEATPVSDEVGEEQNREIASIMDQPPPSSPSTVRKKRSKIELEGRLIFDFNALQSSTRTRSSAVPTVSRLFLTPALNLNASIRNLPSGMRMLIHLRSDYRYQSRNVIGPRNTLRAYQFNIEKPLSFGSLRFGRFYDRMMLRGGYWDGFSFLLGNRKKGIGGSVGFMPARSNEGFSTELPRYAVFAHFQTDRDQALFYRGSLAYNTIMPSTNLLKHQYASLEQRLDYSILSLRQDIQVDFHPITQQWEVSHFRMRGRLDLAPGVDLTGSFTSRQPFRMTQLVNPFLTRRNQVRAGLSLHRHFGTIGASYTRRMLDSAYEGQTFSAYFNTRNFTPLEISFSGSANRWESAFGKVFYANGGIAKNIKRVFLRADYAFYQTTSPNISTPIDLHRISLSTSFALSRQLYWTMRASAQQSLYTSSLSAQTRLQLRF